MLEITKERQKNVYVFNYNYIYIYIYILCFFNCEIKYEKSIFLNIFLFP